MNDDITQAFSNALGVSAAEGVFNLFPVDNSQVIRALNEVVTITFTVSKVENEFWAQKVSHKGEILKFWRFSEKKEAIIFICKKYIKAIKKGMFANIRIDSIVGEVEAQIDESLKENEPEIVSMFARVLGVNGSEFNFSALHKKLTNCITLAYIVSNTNNKFLVQVVSSDNEILNFWCFDDKKKAITFACKKYIKSVKNGAFANISIFWNKV